MTLPSNLGWMVNKLPLLNNQWSDTLLPSKTTAVDYQQLITTNKTAALTEGWVQDAFIGPSNCQITDNSSCAGCAQTWSVRISWTNGDPTAYTRIYRDTGSGLSLVHTANPTVTYWDDTLSGEGSRTYEVRHWDDPIEFGASQDTDMIYDPCYAPAAAPELAATPTGTTTISITYGTFPADTYEIKVYRWGTSTLVGTLTSGNGYTIEDASRSPGTEYCYYGVGVSAVGCDTGNGPQECATTYPSYPGLSAALDYDYCPLIAFDLTIDPGTDNEHLMTIDRNDSGGGADNWVNVTTTLAAGSTYYYDSAANSNTREYRIKFNGHSYGPDEQADPTCPE
ncbi:MAG: hypothetical protein ACWGQW_15660 [bacterium]